METANGKINTAVGRYDLANTALSFLCGVLASAFLSPARPVLLISFALSAVLAFINRRNRTNLRSVILLIVFLAGMLDYGIALDTSGRLKHFEGESAIFECIILDGPTTKGSRLQYKAESRVIQHGGKIYNYREKLFLRTDGSSSFSFGDTVRAEGEFKEVDGARNPGDFDYRLYYRSKGISGQVVAENTVLLKSDAAGCFRTMLYRSKEKIIKIISDALPREEATVLIGIMTGNRDGMEEETEAAFIKTGLSHILSVSGLHVGFLMLLVTQALMPFRLDNGIQAIISLAIVSYYVLLIGAPLPAVRALIMLGVLTVGKVAGRNYDLLASISFAALSILLFNPMAVHDPGFMISFGAMYSIAFIYPVSSRLLYRVPGAIRSTMALSLSVWLGLAPILAYYFNYVSVISLALNIVAVPVSLLITLSGFGGVMAGIAAKTPAIYIFSIDYYLIRLLTYFTREAAQLPLAGFQIPTLPIYMYLLYYLGLVLLLAYSRNGKVRVYITRFLPAYILTAAFFIMLYNLPGRELKMVFLDVGQGDSCCIITPGKKVLLVDGGGSAGKGQYYYDVGGKITLPALLHQGIWRIDTVLVSHMHDDHMEGLIKVIEAYPVKNLVIPRVSSDEGDISPNSGALLELCSQKGVRVYRLGNGDCLNLEKNVRLDFLMPYDTPAKDENQNSLVTRLSFKSFSVLLTGDIGSETEERLPKGTYRSSVLKVPHHGSGGSSSETFLREATPSISIVSVGRNNYGHPSPDTIERLKASGGRVFRTDEAGAIIVTTDGIRMRVRTVRLAEP